MKTEALECREKSDFLTGKIKPMYFKYLTAAFGSGPSRASWQPRRPMEPVWVEEARTVVGCKEHQNWAVERADRAITLVKEQPGELPLSTKRYQKILFYPIEDQREGYSQYTVKVGACGAICQKLIREGTRTIP